MSDLPLFRYVRHFNMINKDRLNQRSMVKIYTKGIKCWASES